MTHEMGDPTNHTDISVTCPNCGAKIPLSEAFAHEAREALLGQERARIRDEEIRKAAPTIEALKQEVMDRQRENAEGRGRELDLHRQVRGLKKRDEERELQHERDLAQIRETTRAEADRAAADRYQAQLNQKDQQLARTARDLEEVRRQASTGSAQQAGIEQQKLLGDQLKELYPGDRITVIHQGQRGADIKHEVLSPARHVGGVMLWERKDTKEWSDGWLEKLRADAEMVGADVQVIVSRVLPKGVSGITIIKDQVVLAPEYVELASKLLRQQVLQEARHRLAAGDEGTSERVLHYVCDPLMIRLAQMLEEAAAIKAAAAKERAAVQRSCGQQENRADRIVDEVATILVELDRLGAQLPNVPPLELPTD